MLKFASRFLKRIAFDYLIRLAVGAMQSSKDALLIYPPGSVGYKNCEAMLEISDFYIRMAYALK